MEERETFIRENRCDIFKPFDIWNSSESCSRHCLYCAEFSVDLDKKQNQNSDMDGKLYNYVIVGLCVIMMSCMTSDSIKIGIICDTRPDSWQYLFKVASAMNIAQDRLLEEGLIKNDTIKR